MAEWVIQIIMYLRTKKYGQSKFYLIILLLRVICRGKSQDFCCTIFFKKSIYGKIGYTN